MRTFPRKPSRRLPAFALLLGASIAAAAAFAHSGVTNPAVQERMAAMKQIGAQVKILGSMAKGQVSFDADAAQAAMVHIQREAERVPDLFRAPESDPKSEALPTIWQAYGDFTSKAQSLQKAAGAPVGSLDELQQAMAGLGETCKACHSKYKD